MVVDQDIPATVIRTTTDHMAIRAIILHMDIAHITANVKLDLEVHRNSLNSINNLKPNINPVQFQSICQINISL
jgi:hypothetical protein